MLVLALVLSMFAAFGLPVSAETGMQTGDSLKIVYPSGGPYVIVTSLENSLLEFNYGWNNVDKLEFVPLGYFIGVYNVTESTQVWGEDIVFTEPASKIMKLYDTAELIPGDEYVVNFFVRDYYGYPTTNGVTLQVYFTAP